MSNFNNSLNNKTMPLYPDEVYSQQNNINSPHNENKNEENNLAQSPMLPLLMSLLSGNNGNNSNDLLKTLTSTMGGDQSQLIQTLTTALANKKKGETPSSSTTTSPISKDFPHNEYL